MQPDPTLATQGAETNDASPLPTTVPIKNNMETLKSLQQRNSQEIAPKQS